jgi:hypothetical protein
VGADELVQGLVGVAEATEQHGSGGPVQMMQKDMEGTL